MTLHNVTVILSILTKKSIDIGYITISFRWVKLIIVFYWFHVDQRIHKDYDH